MKRQLQVVVALAVLGTSIAAANAAAGGINLGVGGSNVSIDLPDGLGLEDLCAQLIGQGASVSTLLEAGCDVPDTGGGTGGGGTGGDTGDTDGDTGVIPPGTIPGTDPGGTPGGDDPGAGYGEPGSGVPGEGGQGGGRGEGQVKAGDKDKDGMKDDREPMEPPPPREPDGTPTNSNPTVTVADFGPAPIGVPNFVIDSFSIPPFLLSIYQACGTEYGIPWEVLASINRIETAFGTNLNVSSAGALGWMQFIPSSWEAYGVDANNDGRKDPYNPVDAICAAANYLKAAGGEEDLSRAIFAYNHADWYVDEVLLYARQYGRIPDDLVGSLTGLTEGARFPVAAHARYADDISEREAAERAKPKKGVAGNAADVISASPTRRGINIYSREGAPVVAVNDGVVKKIDRSKELGRYLILEDAYGNRFTYAQLGSVAEVYPVPKRQRLSAADFKLVSPDPDGKPTEAASAGNNKEKTKAKASRAAADAPANTEDARERLYAFPERDANLGRADLTGQLDELLARRFPGYDSFKAAFSGILKFDRETMEMEALHEGSKVVAGTVLGRVGKTDELASHLHFAIRPTGRGAPKIDPKPILDGWKLLEATAIYRAAGKNPFAGSGASVGQILLMSKEQLIRRTLADPRLEIYSCGREDIQTGQIDRRVMALLEYLTERGYRLTITSLKCGHSIYTTGGSISHHSSGNAVDIAQINGLPVLGNQGRGSITEALVKDVLSLQGTMTPDQVISLMSLGGPSFAMGDHADHVHVGFQPQYGPGSSTESQFLEILKPDQWERLIDRIADIDNPDVPTSPSRYSIPTKKQKQSGKHRASGAHVGE